MERKSEYVPANIEAEESVLSACLLSDEAACRIVGLLQQEDFYRESHKYVYRGIKCLVRRGKPVDYLTLKELLLKEGVLDLVGGPSKLLDFNSYTYALTHVDAAIDMVLRTSMQRKLILAARQIEAMASKPQDDIEEVRSEALQLILEAVRAEEPALRASGKD